MKYVSLPVEFRGFKSAVSAKGNSYAVIHCENEHGEPLKFITKEVDLIEKLSLIDKGSSVRLLVVYNKFKDLVVDDIYLIKDEDENKYLDMEL